MIDRPAAALLLILAGCGECGGPDTPPSETPAVRPGKQLISGGIRSVRASPDGRYLLFFSGGTRDAGALYLEELAGGDPRAMAANVDLLSATFSPDGRALVFIADAGTDKTGTLMGGPIEGPIAVLEEGVPLGRWVWLPGGARGIAMTGFSRSTGLGILTAHDVPTKKRTVLGTEAPFELSASQTGARVVLRHSIGAGDVGTLVVHDLDAGTAAQISANTTRAFSLSPDGAQLAWTDADRKMHLVGWDGTGATDAIAGDVYSVRFSPDGERLGWIDNSGLKSLTVDSAVRFTLHEPAAQIGPDFTSDSNWILVHELWDDQVHLGDLYLTNAESPDLEVQVGTGTYFGSWSKAKGSSIVAVSTNLAVALVQVGGEEVYRGKLVIADGAQLTAKTIAESVFERMFQWSPDAQELVFVDGLDLAKYSGRLVIYSRASATTSVVHEKGAEGLYAWTPDGGLVFMAAIDTDVTHATYGTGELWFRPKGGAPKMLDKEVIDFAVVPGTPPQVAYTVWLGPRADESGLYLQPL